VTRRTVICDLETTGLSAALHEPWEFAFVFRPDGDHPASEHLYRIVPDLPKADTDALRVNRYYERTARMKHRDSLAHDIARTPASRGGYWSHPPALALHLARLLDDVTLICSVPTFDVSFLTAFLRAHGQAPTWHFRVRDFSSIAWGYLTACQALGVEGLDAALGVPALDSGTDDFARALGVDPLSHERHTALGDCRLVNSCLSIMDGAP
jgi:hypothetical protein